MAAVMDCVFFGRTRGYLVVRDPHRKENVYWSEIKRETLDEYRCVTRWRPWASSYWQW